MAAAAHLLVMDRKFSGAQALAAALVVGLGVLVVAIAVVLFRPGSPSDGGAATVSPTTVAVASASPGETASPTIGAPSPSNTAGAPSPSASAGFSPTEAPTVPASAPPATTPPATNAPPPPASAPPATASPDPGPTASAPAQTGWVEVDFPTYGASTTVASITAGGPGFVAVGSGGRRSRARVWTSADGVAWTSQPDALFLSFSLDLVVRSGDDLFAFGRGHEGVQVWRSTNGRSWTTLESRDLEWAHINDVAVVDGTMIAVGSIDDPESAETGSAAWRSTDGVAWQRVPAPAGLEEVWQVVARDSTLVAIGRWPHLSGPLISYSIDLGDTWQQAQADVQFGIDGPGGGLVTLAANDGRFVAVGYREGAGDHEPIALTSVDGSSWTSVTLTAAGGGGILEQVVAVRGGRFVAIGTEQSRATASARLTTDGRAWTDLPPVYTGQSPPMPPEGGDEVVTLRVVAAGRAGVVVAQEWGSQVRVWVAPLALFE